MSSAIQLRTDYFIQTERLGMRPIDAGCDLGESVALYGSAEENKFFETGPKTPEETARYIDEFATQQFRNFPPFGIYAIYRKEDDAFIGHADLFTIDQERSGDAEIGFILKKAYQGLGYGTEVAVGLKDFLRDLHFQKHPRVQRLVATAHPENKPSWRILEKLGMEFVEQVEKFSGPRKVYKLEFSEPEA